ncbi:Hypothetical predicted protein [Pelobates cultripes]|uniref:Uncharacterized protein n=1 Tax=Pelobates cultripes TaxID=61616 RepID=A0AAD1RQX8_PELCU|nr:Hypothetical predicted protein [Pelobates cultripes]
MAPSLKCISINCKGLNNPLKRHQTMRWANRTQAQIILLRNTPFPRSTLLMHLQPPFDPPGVTRQWSWRLNPTLLHNPAIRESTSRAITDYFSLNKHSVTSPGILWAAHKTVIRGTLISQTAHHKKQRLANLEQNLKELRLLEIAFKKQPTPDLNTKIQQHQAAIKDFMSADTAKALQWTRQLFYENSNKADSLLARKLNRRAMHKKIHSRDGKPQESPDQIAKVFQEYFSELTPLHLRTQSMNTLTLSPYPH